jgi:hypothetical protein
MRLGITLVSMICALSMNAVSAGAQGRGNGHAKPQPVQTRAKAESPKAPKPVKVKTSPAKRVTKADARAAKADTRRTKTETKAAKKLAAVRTTPTAEVTPTTPTTRPVKNPKLEARLQRMLPDGTTVQDAMAGFKNWGQFVAAVHVSNNLGIPFADLKARMTGITPGTDVRGTPMSLGQAIQALRGTTAAPGDGPTRAGSMTSSEIRTEVKKAENAATTDLRQTRDRS